MLRLTLSLNVSLDYLYALEGFKKTNKKKTDQVSLLREIQTSTSCLSTFDGHSQFLNGVLEDKRALC